MQAPVGSMTMMLCLLTAPSHGVAQGESAVPFLLISPSPETNGMAGTSVAVRRADPLGAVFSPAQVGLTALSTGVWGTFYPSKTEWLPQYNLEDLTYSAWSMGGGVLLNDFIDLPLKLGVGLAYHRVDVDLGRFAVTNPGGPAIMGYFDAHENASGVTVGIGVEYLVRAGLGCTFRSITSHLSPVGTEQQTGSGEAEAPANDYSGYLLVPVVELVERLVNGSGGGNCGSGAFADLSAGVAWNNVGDKMVYGDPAQADPLPRTARAGIGVAGGFRIADGRNGWEVGALTWSREAEDMLVVKHDDGTWEYQSGLGDVDFGTNVISGEFAGGVGLRAGWQIQVGECITFRRGTINQRELHYDTEGVTLQLAGLLKGITLAVGKEAPSWLVFARDHCDIQYHWSKNTGTTLHNETSYNGLTLIAHIFPL